MTQRRTADILLPIPTEGAYSYLVPDDMELAPGDFVQVPLGSRQSTGVVWEPEPTREIDPAKLREVISKHQCPPLSAAMRRFVSWVASYTLSPPGMVLRMVLRAPAALDPPAPVEGLAYTGNEPDKLTKARQAVLELARDRLPWTPSGLAHAAGVSPSVVTGLKKLGVLETVLLPAKPLLPEPDPEHASVELNSGQSTAAAQMNQKVDDGGFSVTLLEGVTGSGKTEVYFEALATAFKQRKQALILLPEIALTASFLERFEARFGVRPAEWHSELSPKTRERVWRQVATSELKVVAGARSALYLPFSDLGLIVVDEEHDMAYKQEDRVHYNARDMAVVRGQIGDFPVLLCSATPSIESRVNAQLGRYDHLRLTSRFAEASLPDLAPIDMRRDPPPRGQFLSPVMVDEIRKALSRNEQSLLFLNRRGYAPLTLCRVCGHRFQCNNCSAWLVEHRFRKQLQCHHCGDTRPVPEHCPECGTLDHLVACGPGVERLAEEVVTHFPDARTIVLSSDLAGGVKRMKLELAAIAQGEADIIVGTQLVAKGHNFPLLTLVGVVDADLGLANGDPRAAERTFQLLNQVTGRAGRSGANSTGFLQTYQPDHPVLQAIIAGDPDAFYEREIDSRRLAAMPPFGRLAAIIVSATDQNQAATYARQFRALCPAVPEVTVLGPAEPPLAMIRRRYRYRLLVHAPRSFDLQSWLRSWISLAPRQRGNLKLQIDVDPQSFV